MESTYTNNKIEDLSLEVVQEAVASLKMPDKIIEKIELTSKDFQFIKKHTETSEITPIGGIPVIANYKIKKSRIFYKGKLPFCMRCGIDKKKGFWEAGCSSWGIYHKRHVWNNSKQIEKAKRRLGVK
jgi:hypothetical protein